jgi:hypothetical protein
LCGLVGMAGDLNAQHEKVMRTLLVLDSLRGEDSTGLACVAKYSQVVKMAKQVGDPFQLFDHKTFDKVFSGLQRVMIGHNRYATTGMVNRNNAHPFENDTIVGAHNGTLTTKHLLADPRNYTVDSENLYHHFDKHGVRDALKYMGGAWALTWWDKEAETINLLRNKERPLYVAFSEDEKCFFWASEDWMLEVALGRHGIKHKTIELIPEDLHIIWDISNQGVLGKPIARKEPSTYVAPQRPPQNTWNENKTAFTPEVKKEEPSVVPAAGKYPLCDTSYLSVKGRLFETLANCTDKDGNKYVSLFDAENQYYDIRLYAKPESLVWDLIGCDVIADVTQYSATSGTPGKGCYKVNPQNISIVAPSEEEEEEDVPTEIAGPSGKFLTEVEFNKQYPDCGYCSEKLNFGDANRFTTAGACLCPACAKDPAVTEFVRLH